MCTQKRRNVRLDFLVSNRNKHRHEPHPRDLARLGRLPTRHGRADDGPDDRAGDGRVWCDQPEDHRFRQRGKLINELIFIK